mgnify:CR=1 FL=1
MRYKDTLYEAFLQEMHELEEFRLDYATDYPDVPLDRDDPDLKRLTEAIAFFSARSRIAGLRNINHAHRRIFQQFFPYLLCPVPSMAILQALPESRLADTIELPAGTEFSVVPEGERDAVFRTMRDLRVMPLKLERATMLALPGAGFRLALTLVTPFARSEDLGMLSFHVNHLNDFHASLRLLYLLRRHLRRSFVVFDEKVDETSKGKACPVSYGLPEEGQLEQWEHPLQKERMYFHFPERELFLNVEIPGCPRNWQSFTVCLDLDRNWPRNTTVNETMFQLFSVPVTNVTRNMANPIECDGMRWRYLITHPDGGGDYVFQEACGVFRAEAGSMLPLRPGIVAGKDGTYEFERMADGEGRKKAYLELHYPDAFDDPFTVAVDAKWYQPWLSDYLNRRLLIKPYRRITAGVGWDVAVSFVPHWEAPFEEDLEAFLHLFTLRSKSRLTLDDLMSLFDVLGTVWTGKFRRLKLLLEALSVEEVPLSRGSGKGMTKQVYTLTLKDFDPILEALVDTFLRHFASILQAWLPDTTVEVKIDGTGSGAIGEEL